MNEETRRKAVEMVLQEYLAAGETKDAGEAAKEAGRDLTELEAYQLFDNAISQGKAWEAIRAAKLTSLTEADKDRLLNVSWSQGLFLPALNATGKMPSEKDFHRLIKRATKNWGKQWLVIELVKKTGYHLTDQEKKDFLSLMIKLQRGQRGYDGGMLREGLVFLGDWLPQEGAERLFTVLESYQFPDIAFDSMMELAILAKGKVNKDRILNKAALCLNSWGPGELEKTVRQATNENLTQDDYRHLFHAAVKKNKYSLIVVIANEHPEAIKEKEFSNLVSQLLKADEREKAISLAKVAEAQGRLSLETLKELVSSLSNGRYPNVSCKIDVYALALERGINPKGVPAEKEQVKPRRRSWFRW